MRAVWGALGVAALALCGGAASAADLIVDGGFEVPAVTTPGLFQSGFVSYGPGATFGGPGDNAWTVVGSGSNVTVTSNTEYTGSSGNPTYYNAHSGGQWLDLTGDQDNGSRVGVSQTVATAAGSNYNLSFWVGTFTDAPTSIELDVNGVLYGTYANPTGGSSPGNGINYLNYIVPIAATGPSTTLAFYYAGGRSAAGLDDVSFTTTAGAVPEPASWALTIGGLGLLGAALRRRQGRAVRFA